VLDAGCGPGHWTHFLQGHGLDISGVDLVPEFIRSARARFPEVRFRVASLRALDLPDGHQAGVLAWYSLIHFAPTQLPPVLTEFRRILQPQGRLLVGFFEGESGEPFDHAVTTAYYWSVDEMSAMLRDAGFEVRDVESRHDPGRRPHAAIAAIAPSGKTS
jgi:ubiquinone/menaquinone biosynthesis C-methylase UbiE